MIIEESEHLISSGHVTKWTLEIARSLTLLIFEHAVQGLTSNGFFGAQRV